MELFLADDQSFNAVRTGARTEVLTGSSWPVADSKLTFFPTADGGMGRAEPAEDGSQSFTGTPEGFAEFVNEDPTWNTGVSFATEPFEKDVVFAGVPTMELVASVTVPRVHLIANLLDEDAEGKRRRISQFAINPELRNGIATETPVVPGERYTLEPPGFAMAHHLRAGHRLVLQVTTSDPDKAPFFTVDPNVTVFTGAEGTNVTVPVVSAPALAPDDVPIQDPVPSGPAQPPIETTHTTGPPTADVRVDGVSSAYIEFDVLEGFDNASMTGVATPSQPADIDLYLERQRADGEWTEVTGSSNGSDLDTEENEWSDRLLPGKYRLQVHNYLGPPGNEVAIKLTFFNTEGEPGS
jgi:hypothetical protein